MKIAVIGASGRIGRLTAERLTRTGHDVVPVSRANGVDIITGAGLDAALAGVAAVVDVSNATTADPDETIEFFSKGTANLLAAEQRAGVQHHVLLSIVGIDRVEGNAHYAGKRAQEKQVEDGGAPATIVRATQFHDFPLMIATWTRQDDTVALPPALLQPIAPADVADVLVEVATGQPQGRLPDLAGPGPEDLVDMARRSQAARGETVRIVPTWKGLFGPEMAGEAMLPGPDARLAETTFDQWLAAGGPLES